MLILALRTDNPTAELVLYQDTTKLAEKNWQAHRQLAETLHSQIRDLLKSQGKDWQDIEGLVCYKGPGSFTGLRIGLSVANTLAASLAAPIVSAMDDDWCEQGLKRLLAGENEHVALPEYGQDAHITTPRK